MIVNALLVIGALISFAGGLSYLRDTLRGRTRPNRVTWGLWCVAPFIAFAGQLQGGVGVHALITFMAGFNPLLIFMASFIGRHAKWQLSRFDLVCAGASGLGLVLWYATANPVYAVVFGIAGDLAAGLPTVMKAYTHPETENHWVFTTGAIGAGLTLAATTEWYFVAVAFAVYLLLMNTLIAGLIRFRPGRRLSSNVGPA